MLIVPLVVIVGAVLGLLAQDRPRALRVLVVVAPVLSVLALLVQFLPFGVESCSSTNSGAEVCQSLPAVTAWGGPLPYAIAAALVLLSLATLVSARTRSWLPAGVSALLQAVPQVISFGGFMAWCPALAATVAVAFSLAGRRAGEVAPPARPE